MKWTSLISWSIIISLGIIVYATPALSSSLEVRSVNKRLGTIRTVSKEGAASKVGRKICLRNKMGKTCGVVLSRKGNSNLLYLGKKGVRKVSATPKVKKLNQRIDRKEKCSIGRIIKSSRSKPYIRINLGRSCGIRQNQRICFFDQVRKVTCGRVDRLRESTSLVKIAYRAVGKLKRNQLAVVTGTTRVAPRQRQAPPTQAPADKFFAFQSVDMSQAIKEKGVDENSKIQTEGQVKSDIHYNNVTGQISKLRNSGKVGLNASLNESTKLRIEWWGFYDFYYDFAEEQLLSQRLKTTQVLSTNEAQEELATTKEIIKNFRKSRSESEFREAFIDVDVSNSFNFKVGRQLISWGESDLGQIVDVANPRDLREVGLVDIEDAKIPVTASQLSYISAKLEADLVLVHEIRPNKYGLIGSGFDPYSALRENGVVVEQEKVPLSNLNNTEFLLRLFIPLNEAQISIVGADVYDDEFSLGLKSVDVARNILIQVPYHKRISVVGLAGNKVVGDVLLKAEHARYFGREFLIADIAQRLNEDPDGDTVELTATRVSDKSMLGVEYTGIRGLSLILEYEQTMIQGDNILSGSYLTQFGGLATYQLIDNFAQLGVSGAKLNQGRGHFYRIDLGLDLSELWEIRFGYINYDSSLNTSPIFPFREQDRFMLGVKYSF